MNAVDTSPSLEACHYFSAELAPALGRSSDLQAEYATYLPRFPVLPGPVLKWRLSFLLTAAGQPWIFARFPFHFPNGRPTAASIYGVNGASVNN